MMQFATLDIPILGETAQFVIDLEACAHTLAAGTYVFHYCIYSVGVSISVVCVLYCTP